jgi:hypothetical protein
MKRYFLKKKKPRRERKLTNLFATLTIVVVLFGVSFIFGIMQQQDNIVNTYCGDFGFGGMSLYLMKDNTFRYQYYGCSQSYGVASGTWQAVGDSLTFIPNQPNVNLDTLYQLNNNELIPRNQPSFNKFILCEDY